MCLLHAPQPGESESDCSKVARMKAETYCEGLEDPTKYDDCYKYLYMQELELFCFAYQLAPSER